MNLVNVDAVIDDMTTHVSSHSQPAASPTQPQSHEPSPLQTQSQIRRGDDRLDLTPFLDPTVPGPSASGRKWLELHQQVRRVGLQCASTSMLPLEEVPRAFRNTWSNAVATVLWQLQQAGEGEELTRGIKCFC